MFHKLNVTTMPDFRFENDNDNYGNLKEYLKASKWGTQIEK